MERLFELRTDQIVRNKCNEIDNIVEYTIERLPPDIRSLKLIDLAEKDESKDGFWFPSNFEGKKQSSKRIGKQSFCCQTSPPRQVTREHQTQTPVYTTHKRSRSEMENAELANKIRTQLAQESQHVILPATSEYVEMPPSKKHQIVSILNAIVSTYEDIVDAGIRNDDEIGM
jgi:hypothetical protein